ncbi:MAG: hypothetical protein H7Y36_02445, partial [Armatimonadetes bacterium]|nr:hypothetical protein [Akkermansiaceae bacterium]
MALLSSVFWIVGFTLSVVIAPQLRIWTWGPTMLCLTASTLCALPSIWNERRSSGDLLLVITGAAAVFWIAVRAFFSPVSELAQSDILLLAMAVATFISFRAISRDTISQRVLIFGITLLSLASLWVFVQQIMHPGFAPVFPSNQNKLPTGFFAHYSYGASFLIAVSLILASMALHSGERAVIRILFGLVSCACLTAIYYTRSRGGIIGAAGGIGILFIYSIIVGKRDGKKWFAPAII